MVTIQLEIPDDLNTDLREAAARNGSTPEDFVRGVLRTHVDEELLQTSPSEAEISRMQKSLGQLNRGEVVSSEEVDLFFQRLHQKLDSRC